MTQQCLRAEEPSSELWEKHYVAFGGTCPSQHSTYHWEMASPAASTLGPLFSPVHAELPAWTCWLPKLSSSWSSRLILHPTPAPQAECASHVPTSLIHSTLAFGLPPGMSPHLGRAALLPGALSWSGSN